MNIIADLHTHTIASTHAFSTVDEMCAAAAERGLKAIAITDHGPATPDSPHPWHFFGISNIPRVIRGVTVIRGIEANVTDSNGTLDFNGDYQLDYVVASMHSEAYSPSSAENHTAAWLAVCDNPGVNCIGHCGQSRYPFDHEAVVKRCKETGTIIEINAASLRIRAGSAENCPEIAKLCAKYGVPVVVTSDAHDRWHVGEFAGAVDLLKAVDFPEALILNADWDRLKAYFKARKGIDL
ncbi:putative phosphatase [Clostridia bacterium]|nr:putative phosphatase [Clostridia bacterium]